MCCMRIFVIVGPRAAVAALNASWRSAGTLRFMRLSFTSGKSAHLLPIWVEVRINVNDYRPTAILPRGPAEAGPVPSGHASSGSAVGACNDGQHEDLGT